MLNTFSSVRVLDVAQTTRNTHGPATPGTAAAIGNIHTDHTPQLPPRIKQPQLVIPSAKAKPGGRHDNDFLAISDIQILPTYGEIMSQRLEYLPTTDFTQESFHKDIRKRYIDTLFRLYRHNIFATVKDFLPHYYAAATIQKVDVGPENGILCTISFLQLPHLRKMSQKDQVKWWVNSSRLEPGKLLAMVASHEGVRRLLYLVVEDEWMERHQSKKFKEMVSGMRPRVQVKLVQETELDINLLNELHAAQAQGHLFEFCGLIPQAYEPTLTNIQRISKEDGLAFQKWIIPTSKSAQQHRAVPPPKYARKLGFVYKLDCITKEKQPCGLKLDPNKSPKGDDLIALQKATGLNASQAQALVAALSQEFVQIQGPPGTGKTYVGLQIVKVLVKHKTTCQLSPIFIVCETNHALDQFGEHIIQAGIDNVVRVGSRSKSKLLEKRNFNLMRRIKTTKAEKNAKGNISAQIQGALSMARKCLGPIHQAMGRRPAWPLLKSFLLSKYPRVHSQLKPDDAEGFTLVGDPILNWLGQRPSRINRLHYPRLIGKASTNILSLTVDEKWALVFHWLDKLVQDQTKSMMGHLQKAQSLRQDLARLNQEINCRILRNVDIVLMTTSRLAHDNEMLRKLKPKVIICEEAAEVMEPRMMAVFIPGVEHLIQIGDHQQLRPLVQNSMQFSMETKVGKHYQLDRSLFERRVTGEPGMKPLPVIQLNEQQRMPPEISALIRNNVYKDLQDGSSVMNRPQVVGLRERLYWWDHDHEEGMGLNATQSMSYINSVEVAMTTALVRHLVRQGVYEGKDIAILTPYAGQLLKLQAALDEHFEVVLSERDEERLAAQGLDKKNKIADSDIQTQTLLPSGKMQMAEPIRLATVDGFQGEQAKVIIISLVRSNKKSKVGFLKLKNRINVLLSRVQHGMYLIGNAATFPAVDMWKDVYRQISARKAAGPSIPLCCPRHPKTLIHCTSPEDFVRHKCQGTCWLCRSHDEEECATVKHRTCEICKPDTCGLGDIERKLAFLDGQLRQSSDIADTDTAKQLFLGKNFEEGDEDKTPDGSPPQDRYESCQKLSALCQETQEPMMAQDFLTTAMDGLSLGGKPRPKAQADAQDPGALSAQLKLLGARVIGHKTQEAILRDKFRLSVKMGEDQNPSGTDADLQLKRSVDSFLKTSLALLEDCFKVRAEMPRLTFITTILYGRVYLMFLLYHQCLLFNDDRAVPSGARTDELSRDEVPRRLKVTFDIFVKAQGFCDESSKEDADLRRCLHEVFRFKKRPVKNLTLKEVVAAMREAPVVFVSNSE
ncbi:unnamed protein product [Sordaria macrospora k-hell]|uniref:WGS project CABT00000000 data, contig 2.76 n=1 Tax=Sordaria macrospora (strain ATCC MYA-333 / DSM 997 / K(L3346) / K-hell) TaxID=771870 RepID=F7WBI2_SORMK|nr:uncharacterized protein SMAC_09204 [Sordaria macrospora k-hell]CCC14423.1 unnamed protein product [Sordaria macrospora k-hell]